MRAQTLEELKQHLRDHLEFLQVSAELYDRGRKSEAKRLAVSIRVLVHDTKQSKSILGQLGLKHRLFVDTATSPPANVITSHTALIGTAIGRGPPEYVPHLDGSTRRNASFDEWWDAPVVIDMKQTADLSFASGASPRQQAWRCTCRS